MLHLYELASLLEGMVKYCMKGFIPYPISVKRCCLGQVKIWARKLAIEIPDSQAMVNQIGKLTLQITVYLSIFKFKVCCINQAIHSSSSFRSTIINAILFHVFIRNSEFLTKVKKILT